MSYSCVFQADDLKDALFKMKVFVCYAEEDVETAKRLSNDLKNAGVVPWIAIEQLLPGQQWENRIREEIKSSDYFLALL